MQPKLLYPRRSHFAPIMEGMQTCMKKNNLEDSLVTLSQNFLFVKFKQTDNFGK